MCPLPVHPGFSSLLWLIVRWVLEDYCGLGIQQYTLTSSTPVFKCVNDHFRGSLTKMNYMIIGGTFVRRIFHIAHINLTMFFFPSLSGKKRHIETDMQDDGRPYIHRWGDSARHWLSPAHWTWQHRGAPENFGETYYEGKKGLKFVRLIPPQESNCLVLRHRSIYQWINQMTDLFINLSVNLWIWQSISLSIYLSIYPSIYLPYPTLI